MHLLSLAAICFTKTLAQSLFWLIEQEALARAGKTSLLLLGLTETQTPLFLLVDSLKPCWLNSDPWRNSSCCFFFFILCPSPSRHYSSSLTQQVLRLHLFGLIGPSNSGLVSVSLFAGHVLHLLLSLRWCNVTTDASCYFAQGPGTKVKTIDNMLIVRMFLGFLTVHSKPPHKSNLLRTGVKMIQF